MRRLCFCCLLLFVFGATSKSTPGTDCQIVNDTLGDLCTVCTADVGGTYFKCDVSHRYQWCEEKGFTGFNCAEIQNTCGGNRMSYNSLMDCYMDMNRQSTTSCAATYGFATINLAYPCP